MDNIRFDYSNSFIKEHEMDYLEPFIIASHNLLHEQKGPRQGIYWMG